MDSEEILGIILFSMIAIGVIIWLVVAYWRRIKNRITKSKFVYIKDSLFFLRQYEYSHGYGTDIKYACESINTIVNKFKMNVNNKFGVSIETEFNGVNYALFDLDTQEHFELFKKLYSDTPYAIFISSENHYWGIPDIPYKNKSEIYGDSNWKVCNDQKYIDYCRSYNSIRMRGLYENYIRKPKLYYINKDLSENFKLFIDKVTTFYNKEGLELSVMRYKDTDLLIKFNRKRKLQNINNSTNEEIQKT